MIAILDYGSGNLRSAQRAFSSFGEDVVVTSDPDVCMEAKGLVVPGVGAFRACMSGIARVSGAEIIHRRRTEHRPTFGICVGMQILFTSGSETSKNFVGESKGIGIWKGSVDKLVAPILPHMGWNTVKAGSGSTLFKGVEDERFYFVHSYAAKESFSGIPSWTNYGEDFLAAIEDDEFCATQFHPEKSGAAGLKLIDNWIHSL